MKAIVEVTKKFILTLNEKEVYWLKGYIQNESPDDTPFDAGMRRSLWDSLSEEKEKEDGN